MISVMKASKILTKGCVGYLFSIVDTMKKAKSKLSNVHIIYKFLDVFLEDFPGLPTNQEIEFERELFLRTASISKVPYRIALVKLKELKQ